MKIYLDPKDLPKSCYECPFANNYCSLSHKEIVSDFETICHSAYDPIPECNKNGDK